MEEVRDGACRGSFIGGEEVETVEGLTRGIAEIMYVLCELSRHNFLTSYCWFDVLESTYIRILLIQTYPLPLAYLPNNYPMIILLKY